MDCIPINWGKGLTDLSYALLLVGRGDVEQSDAVVVYLDEVSHFEPGATRQCSLGPRAACTADRTFDQRGGESDRFRHRLQRTQSSRIRQAMPGWLKRREPAAGSSWRPTISGFPTRTRKFELPFPELADAAAGIGSAEVLPGTDLLVREHTPEEQLASLSWVAAEFADVPFDEAGERAKD